MHEEAFAKKKPTNYAFDAAVAHCLAIIGLFLSVCAFVFLATTSQLQPPLLRFGLIVFCVCAVWSATLAVRSILNREDDDRAWHVLGICLFELNAPLVLCVPVIFGSQDAHGFIVILTEYGVPLWLPMFTLIAVGATVLARWRLRCRERCGEQITSKTCIRTFYFWTVIVGLAVLMMAPVLTFLYALAPARASSNSNAPVPYPTGWRAAVLEHTPRSFTDLIARGVRMLRFRTFSESLQAHGLTSSDYLVETIESEKGRFNNKGYFAYVGLQIKYPEVALSVSRKVWAECASGDPNNRLGMPAQVFSRLAEQSELRRLLNEVPGKDDKRRALLLERLAWNKREDLADAIQRIAEDRNAPDRFDALCALSEFRKPEQLKSLWFEFLDTATVQQHTASVQGLRVPSELLVEVSLRALEDHRSVVLRCWLLGIDHCNQPLNLRWPLALRALELSEHPDLRVRRGALHVLSSVLQLGNPPTTIPTVYDDQEYDQPWWESDSACLETNAELVASDLLRETACNVLNQVLK